MKNIKVILEYNRRQNADDCVFSNCWCANCVISKNGKINTKTTKPTVRWTPSFYIQIYSMKLFDSLVLVESYEPESVAFATWRKLLCNKRWMLSNTLLCLSMRLLSPHHDSTWKIWSCQHPKPKMQLTAT